MGISAASGRAGMNYLDILANVRAGGDGLTPFLNFALRGVAIQFERLFVQIKRSPTGGGIP